MTLKFTIVLNLEFYHKIDSNFKKPILTQRKCCVVNNLNCLKDILHTCLHFYSI